MRYVGMLLITDITRAADCTKIARLLTKYQKKFLVFFITPAQIRASWSAGRLEYGTGNVQHNGRLENGP